MEPTPDNLLKMALDRTCNGRNKAGFWLAQQLHANRYSLVDGEEIMKRYQRSVPQYSDKKAYTEAEALKTIREEYKRTPKQPWSTATGTQAPKESRRERTRRELQDTFGLTPKAEPQASPESQAALRRQLQTVQTFKGSPAEAYLIKRGIPSDLAASCGVKFASSWGVSEKSSGHPAAVFPIRDPQGKLVAAHGRATSGSMKLTYGPKSSGVFSTPDALDCDPVAVTEAPIDALTITAAAGCPAIATVGTSWPDWLKQRLAFKRVLIATDADTAGDEAAAKLTRELQAFGACCVRLRPSCKDWNQVLTEEGQEAVYSAVMEAFMQTQQAEDWKPNPMAQTRFTCGESEPGADPFDWQAQDQRENSEPGQVLDFGSAVRRRANIS